MNDSAAAPPDLVDLHLLLYDAEGQVLAPRARLARNTEPVPPSARIGRRPVAGRRRRVSADLRLPRSVHPPTSAPQLVFNRLVEADPLNGSPFRGTRNVTGPHRVEARSGAGVEQEQPTALEGVRETTNDHLCWSMQLVVSRHRRAGGRHR